MTTQESIFQRRSIRKFRNEALTRQQFEQLIDFARCAPSAGNQQRLRFIAVQSENVVHQVFDQTMWAALVKPRRNPEWGKTAPRGFIALTTARNLAQQPLLHADAGAAIQNILLGATELGLGSCWLGAFNREKVEEILQLPPAQSVIYLVALGYAAETPQMEDTTDPRQTAYYLDDQDQLHVPKISQAELSKFI